MFLFIYFLKCSGAKPPPERTVHFLEETFSVVTPSQSRHSGDPEPAAAIRRPNSSERPDCNQTWSIKQEVERLMEDHNKFTSSKPLKVSSACAQVVRHFILHFEQCFALRLLVYFSLREIICFNFKMFDLWTDFSKIMTRQGGGDKNRRWFKNGAQLEMIKAENILCIITDSINSAKTSFYHLYLCCKCCKQPAVSLVLMWIL